MSFEAEKLYALLPSLYRIRDAQSDGELKALITLISEQVMVLERNFDQLYDDLFIETCAPWVVPYIGDLVGARGLISFPDAPFSLRGHVAKTITYRRRKGTVAVLEELAFDVTGWNANAVEYFQLLATTQYLNHLRPGNLSTAPVRSRKFLEYADTPFNKLTHAVDVRSIAGRRGKYNIPNIGIYLWRIRSFMIRNSPAYRVDDHRFTFDALGKDMRLYNLVQPEGDVSHLAAPLNVPMPIRRMECKGSPEAYYGEDKSFFIIKNGVKVLPDEAMGETLKDVICICNLGDVEGSAGPIPDWANMPDDKIAIDPVLGRIALPAMSPLESTGELRVNYYYGFSAEMGGGGYKRAPSFSVTSSSVVKMPSAEASTLDHALAILGDAGGVVEITDNDYHKVVPLLAVPQKVKIEIRAAEGCRPMMLINDVFTIVGDVDAELVFNGLLFCGGTIDVPKYHSGGTLNNINAIRFNHCTLVPGRTPFDPAPRPRLKVATAGATVTIARSITGSIRIDEGAKAIITDSIVDAGEKTETAFSGLVENHAGGVLVIEDSTMIGKVKATVLQFVSNTIFYAEAGAGDASAVEATRLQEGCVRFSYIPLPSRVPKPYRCQPASEDVAPGIKPVFTSLQYGDAGYCQLGPQCASEIKQGAENEMEMGVYHHLYQPLREYNLRTQLTEYLRFGLEAGIYYGS